MSGKGFARRVTLENLHLFSPLLGRSQSEAASDESGSSGSADVGARTDPALAEAEQLFAGTSVSTGVHFNVRHRVREQPGPERASGAVGVVAADDSDLAEELLMRVKPRRNGKQLQISLVVHRSEFMRQASHVVAASDGTVRRIGFDYARSEEKPNLARFEAPELAEMKEPVARFRWVDGGNADGKKVLQYEIFDAAQSLEGKRILALLESGIGATPNTKMKALGQTGTVLSRRDRKFAQWYRLNSLK